MDQCKICLKLHLKVIHFKLLHLKFVPSNGESHELQSKMELL